MLQILKVLYHHKQINMEWCMKLFLNQLRMSEIKKESDGQRETLGHVWL